MVEEFNRRAGAQEPLWGSLEIESPDLMTSCNNIRSYAFE